MIIEFTVGNFLSFNEKRTLSFEAQGGVSELKDNFFTFEKQKLLRSVVLYGANSSGKSNLIQAFATMKNCVLTSVKLNETDDLNYSPFLLSTLSENQPTLFEIIFISQNQTFRYGFEYNQTAIINEWLFDMDIARIDVLIHPQSVVHSMVEYVDGAVIAQLGIPDMNGCPLFRFG